MSTVTVPTSDSQFIGLADGSSGDKQIEEAFLKRLHEVYRVFCQRQRKYGRKNISAFGELGVLVRVSDKLARLHNLVFKGKGASSGDESQYDTWLDTATYGVIGMMTHKGTWPE